MPFSASDFFEIALVHEGVEIPYSWTAQPHRLDLHSEGEGSVIIAFADPHTLVFETKGVTLRLIPCKSFATEYAPATSEICLVDWPARGIHHFRGGAHTEVVTTLVDNTAGSLYEFKDRPRVVDFHRLEGGNTFRKVRESLAWQNSTAV